MAKSKANQQKTKMLHYRRAVWGAKTKAKYTLESLLTSSLATLSTVGDRTFAFSKGTLSGSSIKVDKGVYLQATTYIEDEPASTIENDKTVASSKVDIQHAPAGKEFIDGEVFAYIKGDNIVLCTTKVREGVFLDYVQKLLSKANYVNESSILELTKVAKADKLKMIESKGVKEIVLDASLYEASLLHNKRVSPISGVKAKIAKELAALFAKDPSLSKIQSTENLNVQLAIKFDGSEARKHTKNATFGAAGRERLDETAKEIIAGSSLFSDDGFAIITNDGQRITHDEIKVSSPYKIKALGKSLSTPDAWQKLKDYYDYLELGGILVQ